MHEQMLQQKQHVRTLSKTLFERQAELSKDALHDKAIYSVQFLEQLQQLRGKKGITQLIVTVMKLSTSFESIFETVVCSGPIARYLQHVDDSSKNQFLISYLTSVETIMAIAPRYIEHVQDQLRQQLLIKDEPSQSGQCVD